MAMGCDHTGFGRQEDVVILLGESGCRGEGLGRLDERSTDRIDWGDYVAQTVSVSEEDARTACCGPGLGGSSSPKKLPGGRKALVDRM